MSKQDSMQVGEVVQCGPVKVARIQVNVQGGVVSTNPDVLRVPEGEGCLIVWELNDCDGRWEFLGYGIAFKSDVDRQFTNPYRYKNGKTCVVLDRNSHEELQRFPYTVALVDSGHRQVIHQDPIIENEGDGRSM